MIDVEPFRIAPGTAVDLHQWPTSVSEDLPKKKVDKKFRQLSRQLVDLQKLLFANQKHALLVIFQAMDAGGKDSTIRHVFRQVDPAGVRVRNFGQPSLRESQHDFLWRIHMHTPPRGMIAVFNRSHYEDVVAVRVRKLQPEPIWKNRFRHICAFERLLTDEHTLVLKFFLHISPEYQRERLERRLARADKQWKFDPSDLDDRRQWDAFQEAYSEAIERTSTATAPWYIIPAERRRLRDLLVLQVVVDHLRQLHMSYPAASLDTASLSISGGSGSV